MQVGFTRLAAIVGVEYVRRAKKISRHDQDAILGANAAALFGICHLSVSVEEP